MIKDVDIFVKITYFKVTNELLQTFLRGSSTAGPITTSTRFASLLWTKSRVAKRSLD